MEFFFSKIEVFKSLKFLIQWAYSLRVTSESIVVKFITSKPSYITLNIYLSHFVVEFKYLKTKKLKKI